MQATSWLWFWRQVLSWRMQIKGLMLPWMTFPFIDYNGNENWTAYVMDFWPNIDHVVLSPRDKVGHIIFKIAFSLGRFEDLYSRHDSLSKMCLRPLFSVVLLGLWTALRAIQDTLSPGAPKGKSTVFIAIGDSRLNIMHYTDKAAANNHLTQFLD